MKFIICISIVIFSATALVSAQDCSSGVNATACCELDGCLFIQCLGKDAPVCVNATLACENGTELCTQVDNTTVVSTQTPVTEETANSTLNDTTSEAPDTTPTTQVTDSGNVSLSTENPQSSTAGGNDTTHSDDVVSTAAPITEQTTSPITSTGAVTDGPKNCSGGFDAGSFVGGIVLAAGVIGIIIFALKFYQSRSATNYHQF